MDLDYCGYLDIHRIEPRRGDHDVFVGIRLLSGKGHYRGTLNLPAFGPVNVGTKYRASIHLEQISDVEFAIGITRDRKK